MSRIGNGASAWQRYDSEVEINTDGRVDHAQTALANLREAGEIAKQDVIGPGQALAGKNILADGDRRVDGVGHYLANLGVAALMSATLAPAQIAKDLSDTAVHGVLAGFQAIF